jgi:RNA-directed DNA polymerase
MRVRKKEIPKANGKVRILGIPTIRDRVVQGAMKLILEPIFEADFQPGSFGFRPKRSAHQALDCVERAIIQGKTRVIDVDLRAYFDNVAHSILLEKVAQRVDDADVMHLLKMILTATGKKGVPQGGVLSPLVSNLYLNEVDRMLERAKAVTRHGLYTDVEYARYADDLVVLVDGYPRAAWLVGVVGKRLREELAKLKVEVNEEKSRTVDLARGGSFGFLGFNLRRVRSLRGRWRAHRTPQVKKRTVLIRKLKEIFHKHRSQPVEPVIDQINPILRGWVNYFRVGNSAPCFSYLANWVEERVRRHLMHAQKRQGYGWKRWSRHWLYEHLGLFHDYQVRYWRPLPKASPAR